MKLLLLILYSSLTLAMNGFNLSAGLIPEADIRRGGPPRDGIPAIDNPKFIDSKSALAKFTKRERAINVGNKLYPISILNWHEIVNDGENVITYCPLCGTGIVFKSEGRVFGVSGLLYQSDVLLYDKQSDSLWSQLMLKAVTGKSKGKALMLVESRIVNLYKYLEDKPQSIILSDKTGFFRDYKRDPYRGYEESKQIFFPIKHRDDRFFSKEWTILFWDKTKAYLVATSSAKSGVTYRGEKLLLKDGRVQCPSSKYKCISGYWFALRTFYPHGTVLE